MANLKVMGRQSGPGLASFHGRSRRMGSRSWATRGFTLIELMIVVAVMGVLLAIAYPSYQDAVRKSRRGQAKADLVAAAHNMERFHTENNTYDGAPVLLSSTPHYTIATAAPPTQGTFALVATPNGDQEQDRCGNLQLDHAGVRMHSEGDDFQCEFGTLGP